MEAGPFKGVSGVSDLPLGLQLKGVVGKSNFNKAVYEGIQFHFELACDKICRIWRYSRLQHADFRASIDSSSSDLRTYHLHTLESRTSLEITLSFLREGGVDTGKPPLP